VKGADEVFVKLQALVAPLGMTRYYTDHWGAYTRHGMVNLLTILSEP